MLCGKWLKTRERGGGEVGKVQRGQMCWGCVLEVMHGSLHDCS